MRFFRDDPRPEARAYHIWLILICRARHRLTITYDELSGTLGPAASSQSSWTSHSVSVGLDRELEHIDKYCKQNKLPPLTMLVTDRPRGTRHSALFVQGGPNRELERVFDYGWYDLVPPTPEVLAEACRR